jgi:hypothetical protein
MAVPVREMWGRLQEDDDRWAPPVIGGKEGESTGSG